MPGIWYHQKNSCLFLLRSFAPVLNEAEKIQARNHEIFRKSDEIASGNDCYIAIENGPVKSARVFLLKMAMYSN